MDNIAMQVHFGMNQEMLTREQLRFRVETCLGEEFREAVAALDAGNAEELVDAHIDLIVFALGNLFLMGIDFDKAWKAVYEANMAKVRGTKSTRPESGGFDLIKPEGWLAPSHEGNHGVLTNLLTPTPAA